jgi:hypothetical protein
MQKLLKPLEPVEEEVECSEITTPASEAVDLTKWKRHSQRIKQPHEDDDEKQTSIMSSHKNSHRLLETAQTTSDLPHESELIQKLMIDPKIVSGKILQSRIIN